MSDSSAISQHWNYSFSSWFNWRQTSSQSLLLAESKLFQSVKNTCNTYFIWIFNGTQCIRTLEAGITKVNKNKTPIVMLHGLGAGIGFWCKNIDPISDNRKLYAFDLLGFGFSSRPTFPKDAVEAENIFVESFEEWRLSMGLECFILLGHSFGGFVAYAYAIKYPQYVRHLILADPWGFCSSDPYKMPVLQQSFVLRNLFPILRIFNPMTLIRLFGPWGPALVRMYINDLGEFFKRDIDFPRDIYVDSNDIFDYIYHCNAQNPSGEIAFKSLSLNVGSAYHNMVDRIDGLDKRIPITFIFGAKSWLDSSVGFKFYEERPESYVDIRIFPDCAHHIYIEDFVRFNKEVNDICELVDRGNDTIEESKERYQSWIN